MKMLRSRPVSGYPQTVLVTGASTGIGRETALLLAQNGWRVFAGIRNEKDAEALSKDAQGIVEPLRIDVEDQQSISKAREVVEERLGDQGLDALVNNAGVGMVSPVEHTSLDKLREIFEVNLFGQIAVIQAFLPLVRRAKGRIVNMGSVGDHITPPFGGALGSSKAAFASMTSALRLELRSQGIYVSLVEPGAINTPAVDKTLGAVEKTIAELPKAGAHLYGPAMRTMTRTFAKTERSGSVPKVVAEVVERVLTDRNPGTRYPAGKESMKLALLAWLLPERMLDLAILKTFGLPTTFGKPVSYR